jgi:CRP-like cAMP-binding protein
VRRRFLRRQFPLRPQPRSADVVANSDSLVVKITAAAFDRLAGEAPEIATPILRAD